MMSFGFFRAEPANVRNFDGRATGNTASSE
jgi:hypothetical protein